MPLALYMYNLRSISDAIQASTLYVHIRCIRLFSLVAGTSFVRFTDGTSSKPRAIRAFRGSTCCDAEPIANLGKWPFGTAGFHSLDSRKIRSKYDWHSRIPTDILTRHMQVCWGQIYTWDGQAVVRMGFRILFAQG